MRRLFRGSEGAAKIAKGITIPLILAARRLEASRGMNVNEWKW
jgi:hypothetical protein